MSLNTYQRIGHLTLSALSVAVLCGLAPPALAQLAPGTSICGSTTPGGTNPLCDDISGPTHVLTGQTCPADRGANSCSANEFVGNANVQSNSLLICTKGDILTNQSLSFNVTSSSADRFAVGLFVAEQNQNLSVAGSGSCSVTTFPTANAGVTPYPWSNTAGVCGSYAKNFTSMEQVDGLTFVCNPDPTGKLQISYEVTYDNNGASTCTGPGNVAPGAPSKCAITQASQVGNVTVQYNADPACSISNFTYDPATGSVVATVRITNSGPDEAGPAGLGDVTFSDDVDPQATVNSVTCGNPLGGAVCGAVSNTGNHIAGTISTLPSGGSVDITITGTVPPGGSSLSSGTFTLAVNGGVVIVPQGWPNTCLSAVQLPVRLQSFDVK